MGFAIVAGPTAPVRSGGKANDHSRRISNKAVGMSRNLLLLFPCRA